MNRQSTCTHREEKKRKREIMRKILLHPIIAITRAGVGKYVEESEIDRDNGKEEK